VEREETGGGVDRAEGGGEREELLLRGQG